MKIIIAGAGEVGTHLAKMLSNENQDIILLDSDQERLNMIDDNYNLMTWNASTTSFDALEQIGISDTDLFIAVTPFETRNITTCAIAKKLGARRTVARIDNFEFLEEKNRNILRQLGVDHLIYPEYLAAGEITKALEHSWTRYWGELHNGLMLIGVKIREGSVLVSHQLKDLPGDTSFFHVAAIKRYNETIIPTGNDSIESDDIVYFITNREHVDALREICGKKKRNIKRVMIMGGSRIAVRFALQTGDRFHIKIIDSNRDYCEQLATRLPDCEIACGDARDLDVLRENNIYQYDAFLALTDSSESNILSCLTAKESGVPKTIAEVENFQFVNLAENLNIGSSINKKILTSSRIFQLLLDADSDNAKCLALTDAEVAELQVGHRAKITKAPVRDLRLPKGMTLAAVVHDGVASLVNGDTHIHEGDYVVVFCVTGFLHKIEAWFR